MLDFARWYAGKEFSFDWTSRNFAVWSHALAAFRDRRCDVLEIGSWEGRSAIFFLELLPQSRVTCIDSFEGGREHVGDVVALVEERFDRNLAGYGSRVEKMKARSVVALIRLIEDNRMFDVVYVDGSHERDDVMLDSLLSFRMLRPGGYMIWDDYLWNRDTLPVSQRPQVAVDCFLAMRVGEFCVEYDGPQVIVRKSASEKADALPPHPARTPRNFLRFLRGEALTELSDFWRGRARAPS